MSHTPNITSAPRMPYRIGNEATNERCLVAIRRLIDKTSDRILNLTTFDFGKKVMALTLQGIIVADARRRDTSDHPTVVTATYAEVRTVGRTSHNREMRLILQDQSEVTYRMGDPSTLQDMRDLIDNYQSQFLRNGDPQFWKRQSDKEPQKREVAVGASGRVLDGTRVPDNAFFLSGLSSRDYIRNAVFERVEAEWSGTHSVRVEVGSRCASKIADVLIASEDAVLTGRSQREFEDLVDMCAALVLTTVSECYMAHDKHPSTDPNVIEFTAATIVNDGLEKMGSDVRVEWSHQGFLIRNRGAGLATFPGEFCLWDRLGLSREIDVKGQSWNRNGISTFFHQLDFAGFRYWDAIYWRTGFLDRQIGERRFSFVDEYDARASRIGDTDHERRARVLADHSDGRSLWFAFARRWRMKDHMILTFETNRTRSIETVDLPRKFDLREQYHSRDPRVSMTAKNELVAWAIGREHVIPEIEAVLGRPYYELLDLSFGGDSPTDATEDLNQSVATAVDDIIEEAVSIMSVLHVRPYILWISETELMIAAARPGTNFGPWNRADVEEKAPLLAAVDGVAVGGNNADLIDWSNARRTAYEPGYDWSDVENDDARLKNFLANRPDLERLLNSESWSDDDRVLMHRLVRLGRFGYGLPEVRKPEYRNIHVLP